MALEPALFAKLLFSRAYSPKRPYASSLDKDDAGLAILYLIPIGNFPFVRQYLVNFD